MCEVFGNADIEQELFDKGRIEYVVKGFLIRINFRVLVVERVRVFHVELASHAASRHSRPGSQPKASGCTHFDSAGIILCHHAPEVRRYDATKTEMPLCCRGVRPSPLRSMVRGTIRYVCGYLLASLNFLSTAALSTHESQGSFLNSLGYHPSSPFAELLENLRACS